MFRSSILACALAALTAAGAATANAAEETTSDDSAPFAGGPRKEPAPFSASPSAGFGAIGQWVLTMRTAGDEGYVFLHKASGGAWELSLHPSLDYFITSNVSVGATVGYFHSSADTGITVIDLGGRAGFNLNINDHLGFWPTAGLGVNIDSRDYATDTRTTFGVFAPFLYHLVPHLFVGLGPSFSTVLSGGGGELYGIDFVLGGWL
jgi:hypothetical protein